MPTLKLSDLHPDDVTPVKSSSSSLKLSDLHPDDVTPVEQSTQKPNDWSNTESFGQGALQGATAGFSDELGGAVGAAMEKAAGNPNNQSLVDLYKEYRDMNRGRNKAAEVNPWAYGSGNVAGTITGAVLAPEALAAKATGIGGAATLGAVTGLGTSEADTIGGDIKNTAIGAGSGTLGYGVMKGVGKLLNPVARKIGQAGQSLFGKAAKQGLDQDTEQFANTVVNGIKNEKIKLNDAYNDIMSANQDKRIDLSGFVDKLKQRADEFDTSLPEQARDKKAIMSLIQKVTEGPEVDKQVMTGFKPGKQIDKDVLSYIKGKTVPSAQEELESEGARLIESQKQLGKPASQSINPSEDQSLLTRILRTEGEQGPSATAKTVENTPGYSTITPVTESQPFSQEISPMFETQTIRKGGSLTPSAMEAKTLRTNLGKIANERNLSSSGEQFADATYSDLTNTLKDQIPNLRPTDAAYTAMLRAGKKLGIKGNDEDVIRVLGKLTSDNQGKEILVNQALSELEKVSPKLANSIRTTAKTIDQKADMIDKVNNIGNFNVLNPKQLITGIVKNFSGIRSAAGNLVGQAERGLTKTTAGTLVQKSITNIPIGITANPFTQEGIQGKTSSKMSNGENLQYWPSSNTSASNFDTTPQSGISSAQKVATNLYTATNDSLKEVANNLSKDPQTKFYGEHLNKAIDSNDQSEKNRAVFLIMQNPASRRLIMPVKEK